MGRCGSKRRDEVGGEPGLRRGIGRRTWNRRDGEAVEMEVGELRWIPSMDAELGLAIMGGGTDVVDGDVAGRDKAGEVEELIEMTLCRQWHHDDHHLAVFSHDCELVLVKGREKVVSINNGGGGEERNGVLCFDWFYMHIPQGNEVNFSLILIVIGLHVHCPYP